MVLTGSAPLTYRELQRLIEHVRAQLRAAGFDRNARIAVAFPNGSHAALAIVAVSCAAVAIPLNPKLTLAEIETCLASLRPDAVLLLRRSNSAARRAAKGHGIAIIEAIPARDAPFELKVIGAAASTAAPLDEPEADAPAFILQTSGTASQPKSIPFTHRNMLAAAARLQAWFDLTPRDRCLCVSPVYYSHGLKVTVFTPLLTGGTVAFPADPAKFDFSKWFTELKPTWYSAGPTLHRLILDRTKPRADAKMHALRFVLSGGAPLPREVQAGLQNALGVPVVEHYGSSEAAQIAANIPLSGFSKRGTCGIPWPETLMIAGEDGERLAAGQQGEILLRGPTVISGYLDAPELNRTCFVDGWFKTGDIGSLDEDGFLTLHGRKTELINRGGEKIWPAEIDQALMRHPAVAEAAAFGVPHPRLGEEVAAAVVLRRGMSVSPLDLRNHLSEQLASFKVPRRIAVLDQLPKGLTGKVLRRQLSGSWEMAKAGPAPADALASQLIEVWQRLLNSAPLTVDDDFFEKGGDSLLAVELLGELERLTGRPVPSSLLFEASTIRQLTQKLSEADTKPSKPVFQMSSNGSEKPLIYFHGDPAGGSYVKRFANILGPNQPVYVVAPHGLDSEHIPDSLEAMAAECLPSIMEAQAEGPYRLCGYCIGGLVAFEVARLLIAAGESVELVAMIDPPTVNARRSVRALFSILNFVRPARGGFIENAIAWLWYSVARIERFANFSPAQKLAKIAMKVRELVAGKDPVLATETGIARRANKPSAVSTPFGRLPFGYFFWKYSIALSRYFPQPLAVRTIYFSADYNGRAWRRISADLEVIKLPGDHYGVPTDPAELADCLRARLQGELV